MIICNYINIVYLHESFQPLRVFVCVCVLMTSSWSAKSLPRRRTLLPKSALGSHELQTKPHQGERNLQLETAGQFSWAVSFPQKNGSCGHWRLFSNFFRCGVLRSPLLPGIGEKEQYGTTIHDTLPLWEAADMPVEHFLFQKSMSLRWQDVSYGWLLKWDFKRGS